MITTEELLKTVILGITMVATFKLLKRPRRWNEIELIRKAR